MSNRRRDWQRMPDQALVPMAGDVFVAAINPYVNGRVRRGVSVWRNGTRNNRRLSYIDYGDTPPNTMYSTVVVACESSAEFLALQRILEKAWEIEKKYILRHEWRTPFLPTALEGAGGASDADIDARIALRGLLKSGDTADNGNDAYDATKDKSNFRDAYLRKAQAAERAIILEHLPFYGTTVLDVLVEIDNKGTSGAGIGTGTIVYELIGKAIDDGLAYPVNGEDAWDQDSTDGAGFKSDFLRKEFEATPLSAAIDATKGGDAYNEDKYGAFKTAYLAEAYESGDAIDAKQGGDAYIAYASGAKYTEFGDAFLAAAYTSGKAINPDPSPANATAAYNNPKYQAFRDALLDVAMEPSAVPRVYAEGDYTTLEGQYEELQNTFAVLTGRFQDLTSKIARRAGVGTEAVDNAGKAVAALYDGLIDLVNNDEYSASQRKTTTANVRDVTALDGIEPVADKITVHTAAIKKLKGLKVAAKDSYEKYNLAARSTGDLGQAVKKLRAAIKNPAASLCADIDTAALIASFKAKQNDAGLAEIIDPKNVTFADAGTLTVVTCTMDTFDTTTFSVEHRTAFCTAIAEKLDIATDKVTVDNVTGNAGGAGITFAITIALGATDEDVNAEAQRILAEYDLAIDRGNKPFVDDWAKMTEVLRDNEKDGTLKATAYITVHEELQELTRTDTAEVDKWKATAAEAYKEPVDPDKLTEWARLANMWKTTHEPAYYDKVVAKQEAYKEIEPSELRNKVEQDDPDPIPDYDWLSTAVAKAQSDATAYALATLLRLYNNFKAPNLLEGLAPDFDASVFDEPPTADDIVNTNPQVQAAHLVWKGQGRPDEAQVNQARDDTINAIKPFVAAVKATRTMVSTTAFQAYVTAAKGGDVAEDTPSETIAGKADSIATQLDNLTITEGALANVKDAIKGLKTILMRMVSGDRMQIILKQAIPRPTWLLDPDEQSFTQGGETMDEGEFLDNLVYEIQEVTALALVQELVDALQDGWKVPGIFKDLNSFPPADWAAHSDQYPLLDPVEKWRNYMYKKSGLSAYVTLETLYIGDEMGSEIGRQLSDANLDKTIAYLNPIMDLALRLQDLADNDEFQVYKVREARYKNGEPTSSVHTGIPGDYAFEPLVDQIISSITQADLSDKVYNLVRGPILQIRQDLNPIRSDNIAATRGRLDKYKGSGGGAPEEEGKEALAYAASIVAKPAGAGGGAPGALEEKEEEKEEAPVSPALNELIAALRSREDGNTLGKTFNRDKLKSYLKSYVPKGGNFEAAVQQLIKVLESRENKKEAFLVAAYLAGKGPGNPYNASPIKSQLIIDLTLGMKRLANKVLDEFDSTYGTYDPRGLKVTYLREILGSAPEKQTALVQDVTDGTNPTYTLKLTTGGEIVPNVKGTSIVPVLQRRGGDGDEGEDGGGGGGAGTPRATKKKKRMSKKNRRGRS